MNDLSEKKQEKNPSKKISLRGFGIACATFAIIVLIIVTFAANKVYLKTFTQLANTDKYLLEKQKEVQKLQNEVAGLTENLKSQEVILTSLRQTQSGYNRDEWRIIEAEFLVNLASDKLHFEENVKDAITLLQAADNEIRDVNNDRLLTIRKTLANDIENLKATPTIDTAGLYARLFALKNQINKLPIPNKINEEKIEIAKDNSNLSWWQRGLHKTEDILKQLVIVRYHPKGSLPLTTPDSQEFLYLNLQASLEKAAWGLLHHDEVIYQTSLNEAANWVKQYFIQDSPITQNVLNELIALQQINVHPEIPAHLAATSAFTDYFATTGSLKKQEGAE